LLAGPNGEIVCPSLLRSVENIDNPREFQLAIDEEAGNHPNSAPPLALSKRRSIPCNTGEDELSIEVRRPASSSLPQICSEDQTSKEKELPLTQQTQRLPRNGTSFENHEVITGNEGVSAEFGERHQPSQTGLCRNSLPQQSEEEKGYSSLSQTHSMKQRKASDIMKDEGEQLDSSARSTNLLHYKPRLAPLKISTSETLKEF
ncbi:PREDICTED: uncharacterized protein LOC106546421, partial [Thamnophis sirtalis]|uniref:Uncharacterized protein LOC106546421 n=1 Tax=Thamnophis sirtalis TaxID=35019 RepID=A0A6I9XX77_9SAUR